MVNLLQNKYSFELCNSLFLLFFKWGLTSIGNFNQTESPFLHKISYIDLHGNRPQEWSCTDYLSLTLAKAFSWPTETARPGDSLNQRPITLHTAPNTPLPPEKQEILYHIWPRQNGWHFAEISTMSISKSPTVCSKKFLLLTRTLNYILFLIEQRCPLITFMYQYIFWTLQNNTCEASCKLILQLHQTYTVNFHH